MLWGRNSRSFCDVLVLIIFSAGSADARAPTQRRCPRTQHVWATEPQRRNIKPLLFLLRPLPGHRRRVRSLPFFPTLPSCRTTMLPFLSPFPGLFGSASSVSSHHRSGQHHHGHHRNQCALSGKGKNFIAIFLVLTLQQICNTAYTHAA